MLVPVFCIASAAPFLGEPVHGPDVAGGVLGVGGVLFGVLRRGPAVRPVDTGALPAPGLDRVGA